MLFTQIEFFIFFACVMLGLVVIRHHRSQKLMLLAASYYFYAYWDWRFLSLILISTCIDFFIGQRLKVTEAPRARKALLITSLVSNLGILGFFKYFNFFIESFAAILEPLGFHTHTLQIILPIGISFYTFQTLSYTIDVYRGKLRVCDDFWDFALFVAFFPQLVAGPIIRAADFLPQLETPRQLTAMRLFEGFRQFTFGLFKKVFIADRLAYYVDYQFQNAGLFDGVSTWLAVLCYAFQIYCDFSGYSDMAIGAARAMGYDFIENFNHPYLATSPSDFWRRWHISLSSWLKDYLYIPLGGNRCSERRTEINLMTTMLLGGLWHGAAWTFVAWGGLHGLALAVYRRLGAPLGPRDISREEERPPSRLAKLLGWAMTMLVVLVAWVLFRAPTFGDALAMLHQMFWPSAGISWLHPFSIGALIFMILTHLLHLTRWGSAKMLPPDRWYTPVILFTLLWLVIIFYPEGFQPFIYFQF